MGFFDRPEPVAEDDVEEGDDPRPGPWLAGSVLGDLVVARNDRAAVVVSRVGAVPDGFEFTIVSYLHRSVPRRRRIGHVMWHHQAASDDPIPDRLLRVGVAWPDGGRATNLDGWGRQPWADATEPSYGLEMHGGGGSDLEHSQQYWAWPLPADGEVRIVVEWPAYGITESAVSLDAAALREAASRAHPVWAEDADGPSLMTRWAHMRLVRQRQGQAETDDQAPSDGPTPTAD